MERANKRQDKTSTLDDDSTRISKVFWFIDLKSFAILGLPWFLLLARMGGMADGRAIN
jgi:hypothetical protein